MQQKTIVCFLGHFFHAPVWSGHANGSQTSNKQVAASDKQGTTLTSQCFCPTSPTNGHCHPQSSLCKSRLKSRRHLFQHKILYFFLLVFVFVLLLSSAGFCLFCCCLLLVFVSFVAVFCWFLFVLLLSSAGFCVCFVAVFCLWTTHPRRPNPSNTDSTNERSQSITIHNKQVNFTTFYVALRPRRQDDLLGTGTEWEGDRVIGSTAETAQKRPERP